MTKNNISNPIKINEPSITLKGIIAVVGCDGTGKSTLSADLLAYLQKKGPVQKRYLGLVSGETGLKIRNFPVIGKWLEPYLAKKATRAQNMQKKLPGTGTALIMYILSWWRALHLLKVKRLSRRGIKVITDRYPQAEIPGFHYDGPGLTADRTNNWLIQKLSVSEQKLYNWMSTQKPELIIRLNIDVETAFSRKPDHAKEELEDKISVMPNIQYNGANILDIDSRIPYADVLKLALEAINKLD